jgi:AraC-like DNA-binding protein
MYRRNPVITWQPDSPQARLLVPILTQTLKSLATASAGEADAYAAGITGLLDGLLLGDRELLQSKYRERDRLEDMRQYLSRHLSDPDLGADHLCRQFHCSRATVYRLFQREGGIATFILRQRLQRCMQEISRMGVVQKGFLEALAHTWGFSSRANLARHFKAYYGITPQQAVEAARSHQNEGQREMNAPYWRDAHRVSRWLESIAPGASPTEPAGAHGGTRQGPRELAGH